MSLILRFLAGPLGAYAVLAVGSLLAGSIGYGYIQHANAGRYEAQRDAAQNTAKQLSVAVKSKDDVITQLDGALKEWDQKASESAKASTAAAERAAAYESQLSAARTRIHALSEADRGLPDCQKLMAVDLASVCPGAVSSLREWSRRGLQRQVDHEGSADSSAH